VGLTGSAAEGGAELVEAVRPIRDEIRTRVEALLASLGGPGSAP
jgi:hypothetical protein